LVTWYRDTWRAVLLKKDVMKDMVRIWFLLVLLLQVSLLGFIAMPHQSRLEAFGKDGRVNFDKLMAQVMKLNKEKQHQAALDLILSALNQQKEDGLLRHLLLQTFELYLNDEVKYGQADIKANAKDVAAYGRVASAYELLDDNFRAMETLLTGIAYNPSATDLWMKIGKMEHKLGRNEGALDLFKEVTRLDPRQSDAYNNIAYLLAQSQDCTVLDLKKAEDFAKKARALDPKNAEYIDTLAEIHFKQGDHELAQNLLKEAIRLEPHKESFKSHLQRLMTTKGLPWR